MALSDVTAEGVERAIVEFDRLGREAFLARFGFRKARGYFLVRGERRYDSKAVLGVAHGYDRPDIGPLKPQDFSGGDATVARRLEDLGFYVIKPPRNPNWTEEELVLALNLYLRKGLLGKTDPLVKDLSHDLNAMTVHPEHSGSSKFRNPAGVAMKLAYFASLDYNFDGKGLTRTSKADRDVWTRYATEEDELAATAVAIRKRNQLRDNSTTEPASVQVAEVEVEAQHVERFLVTVPGQDRMATRSEQALVVAFRKHLEEQGHTVKRHTYRLPGSKHGLSCDLVDETAQVLYEAKGNGLRSSVRMAIGQLLDYRRFEKTPKRLAVLLPRKPAQDLINLIHSVPAMTVWRTVDGFDSHPPLTAQRLGVNLGTPKTSS